MYVSNKHEAEKHIVFAKSMMQSHSNMAAAIVPLHPAETDSSVSGLTSREMEFSELSARRPASTHTNVHRVIVLEYK